LHVKRGILRGRQCRKPRVQIITMGLGNSARGREEGKVGEGERWGESPSGRGETGGGFKTKINNWERKQSTESGRLIKRGGFPKRRDQGKRKRLPNASSSGDTKNGEKRPVVNATVEEREHAAWI